MKIVFFSESQVNGKIPRDFDNARTEYAWMMALNAPHYNINNTYRVTQSITLSQVSFIDINISGLKKITD